jgi:glyoxalase family protein
VITSGIHHVALVTRDVAASSAFYGEVLGLSRAPAFSGADAAFGDAMHTPGSLIALHEAQHAPPGRPGIGGIHHTAFGVPTDAELLMWKRRLTDLGHVVSGPYDRGYFTSIYFRDPDGQVLEIATEGPGYAIDEPIDGLAGELTVPPQNIVRGHRDERAIAALTHDETVPSITDAMRLQGIHHISGITDDLAGAGHLCEQVLGLRLIKKTTNRDDPGRLHFFWARFEAGVVARHSSFTLFGWPADWNRARAGTGQTLSVSFDAGSHSLDEWQSHLSKQGFDSSAATDVDHGIRFRARDGLMLEIIAS